MTNRARPSAKLLVGGMILTAVVGPVLTLIGVLVMAGSLVTAATSAFYGGFDTGGGGGVGGFAVVLSILGLIVIFAGAVLMIIGAYNFFSTFDALGAHLLGSGSQSGAVVGQSNAAYSGQAGAVYSGQTGGMYPQQPPGQPGADNPTRAYDQSVTDQSMMRGDYPPGQDPGPR